MIFSHHFLLFFVAHSYNQPKFCSDALWNANASSLASTDTAGSFLYGIFINTLNKIYVTGLYKNYIFFWSDESLNSTKIVSGYFNQSYSVFVTINGDIYVDDGTLNRRVIKWSYQSNSFQIVMNVNGSCFELFIDSNHTLYCSLRSYHRIVNLSLNSNSTIPTIRAGTGSAGLALNKLDTPLGIHVDSDLNLYVADCGNDRIQFFRQGELNGTTIAINGQSGSFTLDCPSDVVLDADQYLFIADRYNNRIIGSGPNGFRCIAGCFGSNVSLPFQLSSPQRMAFDSYGNVFVTDNGNARVQKFSLINNKTCGKYFIKKEQLIRKISF